MKRFSAALLVTMALAAPASAMTFSLPDLDFTTVSTTVSSQSCVEPKGSVTPICK